MALVFPSQHHKLNVFSILVLVLSLTILNYFIFFSFSGAPHQSHFHYFQCHFRCLSSYSVDLYQYCCCNQEYLINQWSCIPNSLHNLFLMFHLHLHPVFILPAMNDPLVELNILVCCFYCVQYFRAVEKGGAGGVGREPLHHFLEQRFFFHVKSKNIEFLLNFCMWIK